MRTQNEILEQLRDIAENPRKQMDAYLAKGMKVAGVSAPYTPEELVHSMGFVPFGIWGADTELFESRRYFPAFICSVMQSMVELGIRGAYDGLSFIMMPSLCDSMQVTVENWKYAVPTIPVVYADYPHNRTEAGKKYLYATLKRQIETIGKLTGASYKDSELSKSITIYKEHAETMLQFSALAGECGMKPSDRSAVMKSAWFMLKEEHTALVKELMAVMSPSQEKKIRVLTTGILADQPDVLKTMDELGMTVCWDDVAHESRQYYVSYEGFEPLEMLAGKFINMKHCSLVYDREKSRIPMVINEAKEHKADAILYIQTKFCDPEEFDYVFLKRACEEAGIPLVMTEVDRQMTDYDQTKTVLQTLKEML